MAPMPMKFYLPFGIAVVDDADMTKPLKWILLVCFSASFAFSQQPPSAAPSSNKEVDEQIDTTVMAKETEHLDQRNGKMGLFMWVPTEFWEQSTVNAGGSREHAKEYFKPLRDYNVFLVGVGSITVGGMNWVADATLRKNIVLRDQAGDSFKPLDNVSLEAQSFVEILKPTLKTMMGQFGEGVQLLFFPIKDSAGKLFADPRRSSEFSLVVSDLMGTHTSTYTWRPPLTSILPPKYCPIGKERVEANWKYCPWHGNKLDSDATPAPVLP